MPPGNFPGLLKTFQTTVETFKATWKLCQATVETFQATWKLSRPPGNFSDHSGNFLLGKFLSFALLAQAYAPWNDHFNANIFVYCVQKVFYDGGSPYGGSTAPKASGSPLYPFQAEEKSEQPLSINVDLCTKWNPFMLAKVPIRSPYHSKLGPHWVPILNKIGSPWYLGAVG